MTLTVPASIQSVKPYYIILSLLSNVKKLCFEPALASAQLTALMQCQLQARSLQMPALLVAVPLQVRLETQCALLDVLKDCVA